VRRGLFAETLTISSLWMCELAGMWNDDNVDIAQMCLQTHVRNHGISLFKPPRRMGGILVSRAR
jgi:hypothetical protein